MSERASYESGCSKTLMLASLFSIIVSGILRSILVSSLFSCCASRGGGDRSFGSFLDGPFQRESRGVEGVTTTYSELKNIQDWFRYTGGTGPL